LKTMIEQLMSNEKPTEPTESVSVKL
jgi:hypothetical protein